MCRLAFNLFALLCCCGSVAGSFAWAQLPKDAEKDRAGTAAKVVTILLEQQSVGKFAVDDARAAQLLRRFLAHLDPHKLFFLDSDWQEFARLEESLDDQLRAGDLSFVDLVHERIQARWKTGNACAQRALQREHDFALDESWPFPFAEYAKDEAALAERWRLRIKGEILFERGNGSSNPEAVTFVRERHDSAAAYLRSLGARELKAEYIHQLCQDCAGEQAYLGPDEWSSYFGSYSLGMPKHSPRLHWRSIRPDRPCIWSVIPPARVTDHEAIIGWDLVAIRTPGGPATHLVGPYGQQHLGELIRRHGKSAEVILELQHPSTLQRTSRRWQQVAIR